MTSLTKFIFTALLLLAAGCSTTPISTNEASAIPDSRHLLFKVRQSGAVPVTVVRDEGAMAVMCSTDVLVNGRLAASVRSGEKVIMYLPPGPTILGAQTAVCAGGLVEVDADITAARPQIYRIGYDANGAVLFSRTVAR